MLQRQIMFKQLEELQRQKKLQELNDSRQQNVINQQSLIHNKQASGAQYAPLITGTPVRDPSQMFMYGNANLVQGFQNGLPYSQAQDQVLHSMSLASSPGHSFSRFSHFHGATGEQVDMISRSSMNDQFNVSYQERHMFGPDLSQGLDMGAQTENDQQEHGDWAGNVSEKTADINPSQDLTALDPLEQKFLFETDDNIMGGFGNMFEDTDNLQTVPSLQSGSWSALMQSALEETSSTDTGIQEEWSGLSFQNPELSNDNQLSNFMESGKHPTPWQNSIFPSSQFQLRPDPFHQLTQQPHKEAGEFEGSVQVQRFSPLQVHQGLSGHAGEFEFVNNTSNNDRVFNMGFLPDNQRHSKASEVTNFPAPDSSAQTSRHMLELLHKVDKFKEYRHGTQPDFPHSTPTNEMHKAETNVFTPSNNSSTPQYVGLRLAPPTPRPPANYFDLSQISQQADTSYLDPFKNQDGQRSLGMGQQVSNTIRQPNVWVDIPANQNLSVKGGNDSSEASGRTSFEVESLKQANISPLNPTYSDPNVRAFLKKERVDSDAKVPQVTSTSSLTYVNENYKTLLTTREDQLGKNSSQSHPPLQDASQIHRNNSFVQMNLASTSQYENQLSSSCLPHLDVPNQDLLVSKSKKRKLPTYELLPWHKEAIKGSSRLHDMSIAELEWAQAANRQPEQVKETEALGDSHWMVHPKKRIILTTQLMQVLFRPAPAAILSDDATACYNIATYFAARLALGDACSLANRSHAPTDISDSLSGENEISKGSGDQNLSKIVENFIDRSKKLEDELLRLENGGSVLEIRIESQDLERFSVINRFAKFHSRAQMVAAETASSGGASTVSKLNPQRYVMASPMPRIVPEGHNCLLL